tara:strand:- start:215 stop:406 length:192 start_codon:yes stop_codon:yes gene_type:complete
MKRDEDDVNQKYVINNFAYTFKQLVRDQTLEEVAKEFDNMRIAFGDTAHSFAQYVRDMKNAKT